jgi:3-methyladenine DNA glycosylase AlkD
VATHYFIRKHDMRDTVRLAKLLLGDREDLIHKAVGWMLREMGKREIDPLHRFLARHAHLMPRTMLRYAIERLSAEERHAYMTQK